MSEEEQIEPAAAPEGDNLDALAGGDPGVLTAADIGADVGADVGADELQREVADVKDRYLRLAADFDNYRKRMQRERGEILATATENVVVELLPVVDNLERAVAAMPEEKEARAGFESILKGVELTLRMFHGVLGKLGIEKMNAAGEPFDPHRHEALSQAESAEVTADTVGEVLEPGYMIRGRVIRPARVKVIKPLSSEGG